MKKLTRGATIMETVIAAAVTVMVVGTATGVWLASAKSWYRGAGKLNAEGSSRRAIKIIADEVSESINVTVDANGQGITFQKPGKDANGNYLTDVVGQPISDGFDRRIFLDGTTVKYLNPQGTRILCPNVITTDPNSSGGTGTYKIFVAGAGAITRQVTAMIVTQTAGSNKEKVTGRHREVIFIRNIFDTTR